MNRAHFVSEVTVTDPDTQAPVEVAIYKLESTGAMFGVDSSYITAVSEDEPVNCPFTGGLIMLTGD